MNDQTLKLLEKALEASPGDWEIRAHLAGQYVASGQSVRAAELLREAPSLPANEEEALGKARVEVEIAPDEAMNTLQGILAQNKACAPAYLLMARVYQRRGLLDEARKRYQVAAVLDDSIGDAEEDIQRWLAQDGQATVATAPSSDTPKIEREGEKPAVSVTADEVAAAMRDALDVEDGERLKTTFNDIGGMQEVIERIRMNIIHPFKNPEIFRRFNKKPGGGVLMYGPPGCGKTHIARATAGECGATFISIAITDILSRWLGESEQHLH